MGESHKHKLLKQVAIRWLQSTGCVAFAFEVSFVFIGIVDVMGLKESGDVYVVEAKASDSDLRSDTKVKSDRISGLSKIQRFEHSSKVDFVYYIVGNDLDISVLPAFIGVLSESGHVRRRAKRRERAQNPETKLDSFVKIAKAVSWRKYGHIINHETEQSELYLTQEVSEDGS